MRDPFVVAADEGQAFWHSGGLVQIKTMPDSTGAWGISVETYPPGFATPLHVHLRDAGAFYLLEGRMRIICAELDRVAAAGDLVFLPAGVPHAFRVEGEEQARWLSVQSPEGDFMRLVEAQGEPVTEAGLPPAGHPNGPPRPIADTGIERVGPAPFE